MAKKISDERLLEMLLVHGSVKAAAAVCGISTTAIYKRLQNDDFRQQYDRLQSVLLSAAAAGLTDALSDAVSALRDVLGNPDASPGLKIQAAQAILTHCTKLTETATILRRLDALEAQTDTKN